jgi:hypothetical protein
MKEIDQEVRTSRVLERLKVRNGLPDKRWMPGDRAKSMRKQMGV